MKEISHFFTDFGNIQMKEMKIEELQSTSKKLRIATHTHIKGLGLKEDGCPLPLAVGFVGRSKREKQLDW